MKKESKSMFGNPEKLSKQQPPKGTGNAPSMKGDKMKHEVMNDKMASKLGC